VSLGQPYILICHTLPSAVDVCRSHRWTRLPKIPAIYQKSPTSGIGFISRSIPLQQQILA
jgi:hypothetical protein